MSHIFISYARKDVDSVREIVTALEARDFNVWIDLDDIPKGEDWKQEIYRGIEEAEAFLFLISPDSVASEMCNKEIAHAVKNGKRILPIVICDTELKKIHPEISKRNWIFCRDGQDDFNNVVEEVHTTIHTDYEWLKYHAELQVKALKWEQRKDTSRLLRGKELREAEQKLSEISRQADPQPTKIQREYILASQRNEVGQRRQVTIGLSTGLAIVAILAIFAWAQRNTAVSEANFRATAQAEAEEQAKIARAGELAVQSASLRENNFPVSLLLGVEAYRTFDTAQTRGVLLDNEGSHPQILHFFVRHTNPAASIAFSPDGKVLTSGSNDDTIILWDVTTGEPLGQPLARHTDWVSSVAFSPDGKTLASGSGDKTIILWDVQTHQPIGEPLTGHSGSVSTVAFSPDGKILASSSGDDTIILWDMNTKQPIGEPLIANNLRTGARMAFSPDGKILAYTAINSPNDVSIIVWDTKTHKQLGKPLSLEAWRIENIVFSPDGKMLASSVSSADGGAIIFWDTTTYQPIGQPLIGHTSFVESMSFSPDGKMLASGSFDHTVILWDVTDLQQISPPLKQHTAAVNSVQFSPDGKMLASGSDDQTIILWDISAVANPIPAIRQRIGQPLNVATGITSVAFSPDGKTLASGGMDGIMLLDAKTYQPVSQPLNRQGADITSIAYSPDGKMLVSGGFENTIDLWDVATGNPINQFLFSSTYHGYLRSVAFSPDGKTLAAGGDYQSIILWNVTSDQPLGQPLTAEPRIVNKLAFSPDGTILASASSATILLWDMSTHQSIGQPLNGSAQITAIGFSPDGKMLVSGDDSQNIILWDIETQQPVGRPFVGHTGDITGLAFSPDGRMLASSSYQTVILWDVNTHRSIGQPLMGHPGASVSSVAFSPDGKTLASGGNDQNINIWDVDPYSWIEKACQRVGRNLTQSEWSQFFPDEPYRITCPQWPAGE